MYLRKLGRTGLEVSEIGYGAWGIGKSGWLGAKDEDSLEALNKSIDLGLNFIEPIPVRIESHIFFDFECLYGYRL